MATDGQLVLFNNVDRERQQLARRMARFDGWQNIATGLGVEGKDPRLETKYRRRTIEVTQQDLEAMYEQNWAFARIVDSIPEHAIRKWIKVLVQSGEKEAAPKPKKQEPPEPFGRTDAFEDLEDYEDVEETDGDVEDFGKEVIDWLDDELCARQEFYEWHRMGRLYGGSVLLFGANDGRSMDQPLEIERVSEITHIMALSRYEISTVEWDRQPSSPTYGQIQMLLMHGESMPIHASRCAIYQGIVASRRRLLERGGWGVPVYDQVAEPLRRFGTIYDYVEALYKDAVQGVITIDGLDEMVSSDEGNETAIARLRLMAYTASAFGAVLLNTGETYDRRTAQFSGISEPILRSMDELAGAAKMPLSVLFGAAPTGLSTDDKSGMRNFYDSIANEQRRIYRKPLELLIKMAQSAGILSAPDSWSLEFNPLEEPNEKEAADTEAVRAQTDKALIEARIIDENEARSRLKNDPNTPYVLVGDAPEPDPMDMAMLAEANGLPPPGEEEEEEEEPEAPPFEREDAFDPSQDRDESGKWTSGGGSIDDAITKRIRENTSADPSGNSTTVLANWVAVTIMDRDEPELRKDRVAFEARRKEMKALVMRRIKAMEKAGQLQKSGKGYGANNVWSVPEAREDSLTLEDLEDAALAMEAEAELLEEEAAALEAEAREDAFDPDQVRDETGKWTSGGGGTGAAKKEKAKTLRTKASQLRAKAAKMRERIKAEQAERRAEKLAAAKEKLRAKTEKRSRKKTEKRSRKKTEKTEKTEKKTEEREKADEPNDFRARQQARLAEIEEREKSEREASRIPSRVDDAGVEQVLSQYKAALRSEHPTAPRGVFDKEQMLTAAADLSSDDSKQQLVRQANEMFAQYGISSRDLTSWRPKAGVIVTDSELAASMGANGVHTWDGEIHISADTARNLKDYAQTRSPIALNGVSTFVHEALHGASPGEGSSYFGAGAVVEEVTTEVVTRRMIADNFAKGTDYEDTFRNKEGLGYAAAIRSVKDVVKQHTGESDARVWEILTDASVRYKRGFGEPVSSPEDATRRLASKILEVGGKQQSEDAVTALSADLGKLSL